MPKLTEKQKRFCEEYLIDLNATQAAIRAGYSEKTAYTIGQKLTKKNEVKTYIAEKLESIRNERTADAQEVIEYLTSVMRGESESEEIVLKGVGKGSQRIEKVQKKPSEKDKLKAAELLGKRFGMFSGGGSEEKEILIKLDEVLGGIKSEF